MRMVDIIQRKRTGHELSSEELKTFIDGFVKGEVPDYQASAFAMAICFQGMTDKETAMLTRAMAESGKILDWSDIPGVKVDKHSTGGVGDTTTLVLIPLVASLGLPVAKMSGRGLGHTGGTLDKLESIAGFKTQMTTQEFTEQVKTVGAAVAGQTAELAPADKKLYGLRDVTGTVESIPLIASSIMSKKLASGADAIVLDVKVGEGAFMKTLEEARLLAEAMVSIGRHAGRKTIAVLTSMEEPLGRAVGNALEVREAVQTLRGQGPEDLAELCLVLGAEMVVAGGGAKTTEDARAQLEDALRSGKAIAKFKEWISAQGGDARVADDLSLLPKAPVVRYYHAPKAGVIKQIHAEEFGLVAMRLGAGRAKQDDIINPAVGLVLERKVGQEVEAGEALVAIHAQTEEAAEQAMKELDSCIVIGEGKPFASKLILDVVRDVKPQPVSATQPASSSQSGPGALPASNPLAAAKTSAADASLESADTLSAAGRKLYELAVSARERAYVPYSHFAVGAALLLDDGTVVMGANIENASYGLTNCAERTALFKAVTDYPSRKVVAMSVTADTDVPVAPCGACRQVMAELCNRDTVVLLGDIHGHTLRTSVEGLLPYAFTNDQLHADGKSGQED